MFVSFVLQLAVSSACPQGQTKVDTFTYNGTDWTACEDLSTHGGALVLVPKAGKAIWMPKGYEKYNQGTDDDYYLGLGKKNVLKAKWDMLGNEILTGCDAAERVGEYCEPTWKGVEKALPVMRYSQGNKNARAGGPQEWMCSPYGEESGVRTFVGSRSSSVDATFSDHADDCSDNGFPRPQSYVMNLTIVAAGEPTVKDFITYLNFTDMAEGLVGGESEPNIIFYFPIIKQNFSGFTGSRYWTMIASPVADMKGGREQSVWFRFQQLECEGEHYEPPCSLKGAPQYYDTYWYSSSPITKRWIRPEAMGNSSGFYTNMLTTMEYWKNELANEAMMQLSLPDTTANNGTWMSKQATFAVVRSMISREDTWHPRYGVMPGYGISLQDGFEDTFTATAMGALEMGAFPYAKGVIDNHLSFYVRDNGMTTYRAQELAQAGKMLTLYALYVDYTGDTAMMLGHFDKAKAQAEWLVYRWNISITYPQEDPRFGIPPGQDEGDGFVAYFEKYDLPGTMMGMQQEHSYACASNIYRGFEDIGRMWARVGAAANRPDVVAHGNELMAIAPKLLAAIQVSIKKTQFATGIAAAPLCIQSGADANLNPKNGSCSDGGFRAYPELMYSGVLTYDQADAVFNVLSKSNNSDYATRPMTMGANGYNNKQVTYIQYGMGFGLLQHDMIERFLLHFMGMALHTYTRGTWTTPEAAHPDRDVGSTDYVAAGVMTSPVYLKWALVFEEPNSRTVWLAKALPRDWLSPTTKDAVVVTDATTRYGRISYQLKASLKTARGTPSAAVAVGSHESSGGGVYTVTATVTLPATYGSGSLVGGVVLRLRTPKAYFGKMSAVTVGGKAWTTFDAKLETVSFTAKQLTPALIKDMESIVVTF